MTKEERKKVTNDQINRFFASYYPNWRLQQILTTEKILQEKFTFYSTIISETKQADDDTGEYTIAQEITNGLLFDAISICIQYIEDLFALLKAGENKNFFIKNIITYDAGKIENFIRQKSNTEKLCKLFYFPFYEEEFEEKTEKVYREGLKLLSDWTAEIKDFHRKHHFFYKQYKHGLTVALRPYNRYNSDQLEKCKNNNFPPYLATFDNLAPEKLKDKKERIDGYLMMPCFTENIRPHLIELIKEDNLARYVFPPKETDIEVIKNIAYKVRDCMSIFSNNLLATVQDVSPYKLYMPQEKGFVCSFSFDKLKEK